MLLTCSSKHEQMYAIQDASMGVCGRGFPGRSFWFIWRPNIGQQAYINIALCIVADILVLHIVIVTNTLDRLRLWSLEVDRLRHIA